MPDPTSSATAGGRARRTVLETPPVPRPRPRRSRLLLVGLPMFAVFAAFGAIVWLAYEHGSQGPPVGEPPLVKAPALAIKLSSDESQDEDAVAEGGEVLDMLSDTPGTELTERLLPPPEEPLAPTAPAVEPPEEAPEPSTVASTPLPAPETTPRPAPATTPPAAVAAPREEPVIARPEPAPTPEEAEAALDALLAEVTQQAERPRVEAPPSGSQAARPDPTRPGTANGPASSVRPAVAPPAVSPFGPPGGEVTAIAPDRRPPAGSGASRPGQSDLAALDGPYRIQLAAVRDEADARRAWDLFQVDLGPVLSGIEPFIERADTANGVFYRVQIGPFANLQDAEALCDQLKQRNASCFVIRR